MNNQNIQMFLNRLNWKANTGEITDINKLQIDVYMFKFKMPLTEERMKGFTEYMKNLDMTKLKSIMKMWVWLYQHDVKFRLSFAYNPMRTLRYNLNNIFEPAKLNKLLKSRGHDDLMSCPLNLTE